MQYIGDHVACRNHIILMKILIGKHYLLKGKIHPFGGMEL